jgi:cation transport ATPase
MGLSAKTTMNVKQNSTAAMRMQAVTIPLEALSAHV